jgi:hypothetical protein
MCENEFHFFAYSQLFDLGIVDVVRFLCGGNWVSLSSGSEFPTSRWQISQRSDGDWNSQWALPKRANLCLLPTSTG